MKAIGAELAEWNERNDRDVVAVHKANLYDATHSSTKRVICALCLLECFSEGGEFEARQKEIESSEPQMTTVSEAYDDGSVKGPA